MPTITTADQMNQQFSSYFRHECKKRQITQRMIVKLADLDQCTVSKLWNARCAWTCKMIERISKSIGLTIDEFICASLKIQIEGDQPIDPNPPNQPT